MGAGSRFEWSDVVTTEGGSACGGKKESNSPCAKSSALKGRIRGMAKRMKPLDLFASAISLSRVRTQSDSSSTGCVWLFASTAIGSLSCPSGRLDVWQCTSTSQHVFTASRAFTLPPNIDAQDTAPDRNVRLIAWTRLNSFAQDGSSWAYHWPGITRWAVNLWHPQAQKIRQLLQVCRWDHQIPGPRTRMPVLDLERCQSNSPAGEWASEHP